MTLIHDWNDCWACNRHHSIVFLSQWLHYLVAQEFVQHVQSVPLLVILVIVVAGLIAGTAVNVVNIDCHDDIDYNGYRACNEYIDCNDYSD